MSLAEYWFTVFRSFRLSKKKRFVKKEIEKVKELGVKFETNVVIGKSTTIDQLMEEEDFEAVFYRIRSRTSDVYGYSGRDSQWSIFQQMNI